jgi:ABC-type multidrug transport system fused ATPase/permease subunit
MFLLVMLLLVSIILQVVNPLILSSFIDAAVAGKPVGALLQIAGSFLAIALLLQVISVAETAVAENVSWTATNALRVDITSHCLQLDMSFHKQHTPGELIERIDGDVTQLANFFSRFTIYVLGNSLFLIGVLFVLFRISWLVGIIQTVFAIIVLIILRRIQSVAVHRFQQLRQARAEMFSFLEEWITGTEDIRANGATAYGLHLFYPRARTLLKQTRTADVTSGVSWVATVLLFALGTSVALALGVSLFKAGLISVGVVYLIFSYTDQLRRPLEQVLRNLQDLQQASASINRIQELLAIPNAILDGPNAFVSDGPLSVEFTDVSFGYEKDAPILKNISFSLKPGKKLGILGRTGSGKTTLMRLLFRLYDPNDGKVQVGNTDLRSVKLQDLREHIGLATQDVQLFQASVRDNLTFFDRTIPTDRILHIISALGLSTWYQSLPEGLETQLASDGDELSAGEAQLLALARVFLKDPDLILLDEASAHLDPPTERLVSQAIEQLLEGRTAIVIAHRLETLASVDEVLILNNGEILEYGSRVALAQDTSSHFYYLLQLGKEGVSL